jgi:predicted  nucleic acid-binding Zn-ribbon protein
MRAVYNNVKERLDKFKKEKEPKIAELMKKLDALKPDIPADVFEVYKALTAERKYPAFVAAIDAGDKKHYRCFCGITLSQKAQSELLDKGQCRCENCRRLIYK